MSSFLPPKPDHNSDVVFSNRLQKRHRNRLSSYLIVSFILCFAILGFLIYNISDFNLSRLLSDDDDDILKLKNIISQDVVSLNEEATPAESQNFKHKSKWKSWNQTVVMISLDGFRSEYLTRHCVPALKKLAKDGISSDMHPIFPSLTFPNHFSMVTGVYPDIHGIINNEFYDPNLKDHFMIRNPTMKDPKWWKSNPIWNIAQEQGLASAVAFWPGCTTVINGRIPTHLIRYQDNYGSIKQMKNILKWIDYPPSIRPSFIATYLPTTDIIGHTYGPNSKEINDALTDVDNAIAFLIEELKTRNIFEEINLIVVSDHGMTHVPSKNIVYAEDIFPLNLTFSVSYNTISFIRPLADDCIQVFPNPVDGKEIHSKLSEYSRKHGKFKVYLKSELPSEWNYGNNDRIAPIIVVCEPAYYFSSRTVSPPPLGAHGYPLPNAEMEAIFLAHGGRIRKTGQLQAPYSKFAPFSCIDLFPFVAKLLEISTPSSNATNYLVDSLVLPLK